MTSTNEIVPYKESLLKDLDRFHSAFLLRGFKDEWKNDPKKVLDPFIEHEVYQVAKSLNYELGLEPPDTIKVVFVGAGGVASWVLPSLLKVLYSYMSKSLRQLKAEIVLVDNDICTHKNTLRQNFILSDVGRNKAEILSERYNDVYPNIKVSFIPKYLYDKKFVEKYCPEKLEMFSDTSKYDTFSEYGKTFSDVTFLLNMVDNELTKHMLDYYIATNKYLFYNTRYFCTGCDVYHGLVFTSYIGYQEKLYSQYFEDTTFIKEDAEIESHSCAEVAEDLSIEQTFNSNSVAATLLVSLLGECLAKNEIITTKRIDFVCSSEPKVSVTDRSNIAQLMCLSDLFYEFNNTVKAYKARYGLDNPKSSKGKIYKSYWDLLSKFVNME